MKFICKYHYEWDVLLDVEAESEIEAKYKVEECIAKEWVCPPIDGECKEKIMISKHLHECVEVCPHCNCENTIMWDAESLGYVVTCQHCGEEILLCDECLHAADNTAQHCDWCNNECFRGKTNPEINHRLRPVNIIVE